MDAVWVVGSFPATDWFRFRKGSSGKNQKRNLKRNRRDLELDDLAEDVAVVGEEVEEVAEGAGELLLLRVQRNPVFPLNWLERETFETEGKFMEMRN